MDTKEQGVAHSPSVCIGEVIKLDRGLPLVRLEEGRELRCIHATALIKANEDRAVVGDRVSVLCLPEHDAGIIEVTLPRTSSLVRKDPGERLLPQILAANFDIVLVVQPVEEVNIRRLERELVLAHESGADVAVVLTKADLAATPEEVESACRSIEAFVGNDELFVVSGTDPSSLQALEELLGRENKTAVLIGRSGVGKSSLINMLTGKTLQQTMPVRKRDGKGRHTTVAREIIELPKGGRIIDMPGVRGLGLWDVQEGIETAFLDVEQFAEHCRFRDCTHTDEPGCAVKEAVRNGTLSEVRLESYVRLREECQRARIRKEEARRIRTRRGHPRNKA